MLNPDSPVVTMRGLIRARPTNIGFSWPSIDMVITSGLLNKKGYRLDYIDANVDRLSAEDVSQRIKRNNIEAVVSLYSGYQKENDILFLKRIKDKNPNVAIVILPDIQFVLQLEKAVKFLTEQNWLDAIVLDLIGSDIDKYLDGDRSKDLKNLCYRVKGKAYLGSREIFGQNDYYLPIPRHDLFKNKRYFLPQSRSLYVTTTIMQFGCPYQCDFCLDKKAYEKSWCRSPENMADEFQYIASRGFNEVYIRDLTFGINKSRTAKFCELLIARRLPLRWVCTSRVDVLDEELLALMKKAGCMCIEFGVESGIDSTKDIHKKGIKNEQVVKTFSICRKLGIETAMFMMLGFPEETLDDINKSLQFCFDLKGDFLALNFANVLPGTEFEKRNPVNKNVAGNNESSWKIFLFTIQKIFSILALLKTGWI